MMSDIATALLAALLTGLLGSAHCLGMCAGISGLFAMHSSAAGLKTQLPLAITYNAGRLLSYTILGFAVAAVGSRFVDVIPKLAGPVRLIAGAVIILIGCRSHSTCACSHFSSVWEVLCGNVSPRSAGVSCRLPVCRALGLGLMWGLLPCGLVYSVLLVAAPAAQLPMAQ